MLVIYTYIQRIARSKYYVHMYIQEMAQKTIYILNICTARYGMGRALPQYIFGERHYIQYLQAEVGQAVPLN